MWRSNQKSGTASITSLAEYSITFRSYLVQYGDRLAWAGLGTFDGLSPGKTIVLILQKYLKSAVSFQ